ncbi:hypothetical protein M5689_022736 [Euphorbia peplus]|nr:hypothetical protein M5689_022736 [Euphorbia peplus]
MAYNKTMWVILIVLLMVVVSASAISKPAGAASSSHDHVDSIPMLSRKILKGSSAAVVNRGGEQQLRTVPSGPDPLHHNGATPKKPTTP